jgi:hypothetical protein
MLGKNKSYSFINILGLAIGIANSILIIGGQYKNSFI